MNTITTNNNTVDKYFAMLVDLKPDVKIDLIKKLTDSLKVNLKEEATPDKEGDDIIDQLAGAWHDYGKTAEEIIADIRDSRYSDDQDIKLSHTF